MIVVGQLRARSWETPEGERRSVVEVQAEEVGPSLALGDGQARARHRQRQRQGQGRVQRRPAVLTLASSEAGAVVTRPGLAHHNPWRP